MPRSDDPVRRAQAVLAAPHTTAAELLDLIHAVNPTSRALRKSDELARYTLKSALQSLLVIQHGDDLRIEPTPNGGRAVEVKMTLTAPGCGMGPMIAEDARQKIAALPSVESAKVHIVWDPAWTPQMLSSDGRKILGLE